MWVIHPFLSSLCVETDHSSLRDKRRDVSYEPVVGGVD